MSAVLLVPTQKLDDSVALPAPTTSGAAGADLRAVEDAVLPEYGGIRLIKTGLAMAIPAGYTGFVCSRSGLALKHGVFVLNAPGVIDSDYRGDVGVIICNAGPEDFVIKKGDRIAQLVILKTPAVQFEQVPTLPATDRGEGGFGSTGTR